MVPGSSDSSAGSAPASSSACHGRSSSTCSTPSVATTATRMPSSSPAMAARSPGPDGGTHAGTTVRGVRARPLTGPPRLLDRLLAAPLGRLTAGPDDDDALRVTAAVDAAGRLVALERVPAAGPAELVALADRLAAAGLAGRVELAVPVDRLGPRAGAVVRELLERGSGVAVTGSAAAVDALVAAEPAARAVVRSDEDG